MQNKVLMCIFLDLEKAFDVIWTNGVLSQLVKFDIKGRMLGWIKNFLSDRKSQVRVRQDLLEIRDLDNGSPQGSVLSPVLFNILMNTQFDELKDLDADLIQYAYDSATWRTGKSLRHLAVLCQKILDRIERWAEKWDIKISVDKTESVVYNYGKLPTEEIPKLKIGNKTTEYKKTCQVIRNDFR